MSKFILSRDIVKPPRPEYKVCTTCRTRKKNDFDNFSKKLDGARDKFTTTDVCKTCKNANISRGMQKKWDKKKEQEISGVQLQDAESTALAEDPLLKKLREQGAIK